LKKERKFFKKSIANRSGWDPKQEMGSLAKWTDSSEKLQKKERSRKRKGVKRQSDGGGKDQFYKKRLF